MEEKTLNFDIIKPGRMEQYQSIFLSQKENNFLDSLRDPIILTLLNEYLLEHALKVKKYEELTSFIDTIAEDFPKWIKSKGYNNL